MRLTPRGFKELVYVWGLRAWLAHTKGRFYSQLTGTKTQVQKGERPGQGHTGQAQQTGTQAAEICVACSTWDCGGKR